MVGFPGGVVSSDHETTGPAVVDDVGRLLGLITTRHCVELVAGRGAA
jgi:hypothetical protein